MDQHQRIRLIESQSRAFNEGTLEYINNQWVFFDEETEEASLLDEFDGQEIEVLTLSRWKRGTIVGDQVYTDSKDLIPIQHQSSVRIRRKISYSFNKLLEELNDDSFIQFLTTLNSLGFSIFDCIYCYNQLTFITSGNFRSGVNFLIFDNEEQICSVQHHFSYIKTTFDDRFEFTLNTGKRMIIEKISS